MLPNPVLLPHNAHASARTAAILLVARQNLRLAPVWRPELQDLTGHSKASLLPTSDTILDLYKNEFPKFFNETRTNETQSDQHA